MRWLRQLHAWAGLVLAALAVALGLSGAALVLEADYLRATIPAARATVPLDPGSLAAVAASAERLFPQGVRSVVFATPELGLHQVYLLDGGGAYLDGAGGLIDRWDKGGRAEAWLFDLHHELLAGEPGHTVTGIAGVAAALMALTGLVLWAPAARSFGARIWPRSTARRHLLTQHRELGALAALPLVLFALTGAGMVFPEAARALLARALPGDVSSERPTTAFAPVATGSTTDWRSALTAAQSRFPDSTLRVLVWPSGGTPMAIRLRQPEEWHPNGRTRVLVHPGTGELLDAHDALRDTLQARVQNAFYPLHAAFVGGRLYDALAFACGLALAALGGIGAWSFTKKLARSGTEARRAPRQPPLPQSPDRLGKRRPQAVRCDHASTER